MPLHPHRILLYRHRILQCLHRILLRPHQILQPLHQILQPRRRLLQQRTRPQPFPKGRRTLQRRICLFQGNPELPVELDLSVSEDESLKSLLAEINETPEEKAAKKAAAEAEAKAKADAAAAAEQEKNAAAEREKQIGFMLDTIKKTLPKKIDEATTWTDIEYKDKAIAYIYEADIDMAAMSAKEKTALQNSIKTEACGKAYQEMCPRLKPMFINDGINVRIRYLDKGKNELGICEFNHDTCR